jgi:hypothetical protein
MITISEGKINGDIKEKPSPYTSNSSLTRIDEIGTTSDKITGRAGLSFFAGYLDRIGIKVLTESFFGTIRKSRKGKGIYDLFKQVICLFLDGSSRHITYFDSLKRDEGYAASIEFTPSQLSSSHGINLYLLCLHRQAV